MPYTTQSQYLAGEIGLWLQYDCGQELMFLGCHNLTGVSKPRGDTNPVYCRTGKNKFEIARTWRGAAGLGSATIVAYDTVLNYIQELPCPFNLYALHSACGADDDPTNYDYLYIYEGMEPTSEDMDSHVIGVNPDAQAPVMISMPTTFRNRVKVKRLVGTVINTSSVTTQDLNAVSFCDTAECGDLCGDFSVGCQTGFFVADSGGVAAVIGRVTNGSMLTTIASPFTTATDDIGDVYCSGDLVIVTNRVNTAYAYSWDSGDTWTEVLTPTQIVNAVLILGSKVWMVGQAGYVWYSNNRGQSIAIQDAGVATSQSLNDVAAASALVLYAVGDNNAFIRTVDGGNIWSAVAGPAVGVNNDLYRVAAVAGTSIVFVGDEMGNVYRSTDRGNTWTTVYTATADTAGGIYGIVVPNCNVPVFIANDVDPYFYPRTATGVMYRSIDGGVTWNAVELPGSNTGLNNLWACDVNTYWVVGEDGYFAKVAGPSI